MSNWAKWEESLIRTLMEKRKIKPYNAWLELSREHGLNRTYDAFGGKVRRMIAEGSLAPKYRVDHAKIGYLDIETTGLDSDWNQMLCWCIKERETSRLAHASVTPREAVSLNGDKRITVRLLREMARYDLLIGWYSKYFDTSFIFVRCLSMGLAFPRYCETQHIDAYLQSKTKLASLSSRRLENVSRVLGIPGKGRVDPGVWAKAKRRNPGQAKALREVLRHCKEDVVVLEKTHMALEGYFKGTSQTL